MTSRWHWWPRLQKPFRSRRLSQAQQRNCGRGGAPAPSPVTTMWCPHEQHQCSHLVAGTANHHFIADNPTMHCFLFDTTQCCHPAGSDGNVILTHSYCRCLKCDDKEAIIRTRLSTNTCLLFTVCGPSVVNRIGQEMAAEFEEVLAGCIWGPVRSST